VGPRASGSARCNALDGACRESGQPEHNFRPDAHTTAGRAMAAPHQSPHAPLLERRSTRRRRSSPRPPSTGCPQDLLLCWHGRFGASGERRGMRGLSGAGASPSNQRRTLPARVVLVAKGRCAVTRGPRLAFGSARVSRPVCRGWLCPRGAAGSRGGDLAEPHGSSSRCRHAAPSHDRSRLLTRGFLLVRGGPRERHDGRECALPAYFLPKPGPPPAPLSSSRSLSLRRIMCE
jgi:hypothetical protein